MTSATEKYRLARRQPVNTALFFNRRRNRTFGLAG